MAPVVSDEQADMAMRQRRPTMKMNDEDPDSMVVQDGFNEAGMAEQMFADAGLPQ